MFDFVRDLRKSAAEKRQERLNAYVDGELSPQQMLAFEQELTQDADLQAEVEMRQVMKAQLSQLPRRPVPRNFTLDPAKYGRPAAQPLFQLYPVMRVATVMTAFFFVLAIGLSMMTGPQIASTFAPISADLESASEAPAGAISMAEEEGQAVEVTRIVAETVVEEVVEEEGEVVEVTRVVTEMDDTADQPADEAAMEEPAEAAPPADSDTDQGESTGVIAPTSTNTPTPTPTSTPTSTPIPTQEIAQRAATAVATLSAPIPNQPEPVANTQTIDWWGIAIIASLILFIILLTLTLYVRRQMM